MPQHLYKAQPVQTWTWVPENGQWYSMPSWEFFHSPRVTSVTANATLDSIR